jgi:HEPN domain-containing protein
LQDTRAWLIRAHQDLRGADVDLEAAPPLLSDATFHCQQAAEKAMTGLASILARVPAQTHP